MRRVDPPLQLNDFDRQVPRVNNWFQAVTERFDMYSGSSDPALSEVPENQWIVYKNTTSGEVRIWVNDGGSLKKSAAFT